MVPVCTDKNIPKSDRSNMSTLLVFRFTKFLRLVQRSLKLFYMQSIQFNTIGHGCHIFVPKMGSDLHQYEQIQAKCTKYHLKRSWSRHIPNGGRIGHQ